MDIKIGEHYIASLFGLNVHLDTLITLWIAMILILFFSILATSKIQIIPTKVQSIFEKIVTIFVGLTSGLGKNQGHSALILMCIFLLILVSNLLGQVPLKIFHLPEGEFASPTNDLNMTAALALFVLIYYIYKGIKAKGLNYFKHYVQPVWFMTPFNILEDFTRPITLMLRLFANIVAGEVMVVLFAGIIAVIVSPMIDSVSGVKLFGLIPENLLTKDIWLFISSLLALPIMLFELFVAFIQALVFTFLASAYIQNAVSDEH